MGEEACRAATHVEFAECTQPATTGRGDGASVGQGRHRTPAHNNSLCCAASYAWTPHQPGPRAPVQQRHVLVSRHTLSPHMCALPGRQCSGRAAVCGLGGNCCCCCCCCCTPQPAEALACRYCRTGMDSAAANCSGSSPQRSLLLRLAAKPPPWLWLITPTHDTLLACRQSTAQHTCAHRAANTSC